MRSFNNFLKEATETSASRQAKLLGLVGDGHGGWYDAKGKFVAKTEQGKLKFYGQGGACLLYTSPSPRDSNLSRMPSSA